MSIRHVNDSRFDPFSEINVSLQIEGEHHTVRDQLVHLQEVPDLDYDITVTDIISAVAMTEVTAAPSAGEYRVDRKYETGLLLFHGSENDLDVDVDYYGKGSPVLDRDHNWGGGGFKSAFPAGFGGDGSDGAVVYSVNSTITTSIKQFTSLTVGATINVHADCAGVLMLGVQGRLTLSSLAYFNLAGTGPAGPTTKSAGGLGDPTYGASGANGQVRLGFVMAEGGVGNCRSGGGGGGQASVSGSGAGGGGGGIKGGRGGNWAVSGAEQNVETGYGRPGFSVVGTTVTSHIAAGSFNPLALPFLHGRHWGCGGSGGSGGAASDANSGDGGNGGGSLYIECDELYFSDDVLKAIWATVAGGNGTAGSGANGGGGGGGTVTIVCNRIKGYNADKYTRQAYMAGRTSIAGGAAGGVYAGAGGMGCVAIIELDPDGRD